MPTASATSSTPTSSKPRAAKRSMATLLMWSVVVERRRPTRCWESGRMHTPFLAYGFHLGTRCHIIATSVTLSRPTRRKVLFMEPNQQVETEAELVTETLVEEV